MSEANALHSLYGGKQARKALAGTVGGQKREQTVLTPEWLLDAIRAVAPIGLDPCTTPENPTGAKEFCSLTQDVLDLQEELAALPKHAKGARKNAAKELKSRLQGFGLSQPWHSLGVVYVNPPYNMLYAWSRKCEAEAFHGTSIYLLAPFRPQRKWFCEYTKGYTVASLAPFPFVGHKQAFPAPLCLVCYNLPVPNLGKYLTGTWSVE